MAPLLAGGGLLGTPLRGLPCLCVIGRQRLGEVGQDAAEKLGLVGGLWGRLLRIGEEKMRCGCTMLCQELCGVRQFFGMRRARGASMKALVEGVYQRLRSTSGRRQGRRMQAWMGSVAVGGKRGCHAGTSREKRPSALVRAAAGSATAGPGHGAVHCLDRGPRATSVPQPSRHRWRMNAVYSGAL